MKRQPFTILWLIVSLLTMASSVFIPAVEKGNLGGGGLTTPTRTPTKTPTRIPGSTDFNSTTANTTPPGDIDSVIEEVANWGLGGGSGDDNDPCKGIKTLTVVSEWFEIEQMQYAWVQMCGWGKNKNVTAKLTKPNGTTIIKDAGTPYNGSLGWEFLATVADFTGKYKAEFSNGAQLLTFEFIVDPVSEPGVMLPYTEQKIYVYKFQPSERVRLFRYDIYDIPGKPLPGLKLQAWQEFKTDVTGTLIINLSDPSGFYVVVGEKSGEFPLSQSIPQSILKNQSSTVGKVLCSGAPKSRVGIGSIARVTFTDGTPTRIRIRPTTSSKILGRLAEGTQFLIVKGPKCSDGYTWWQIQLGSGKKGWMAEGSPKTYYLEPVTAAQAACKMKARLTVAGHARVARVDGSMMRIRRNPGFSQDVLYRVPEGTALTILVGPKCVDGANWWKIRTDGGQQGWMTESQNGTYLLEPTR